MLKIMVSLALARFGSQAIKRLTDSTGREAGRIRHRRVSSASRSLCWLGYVAAVAGDGHRGRRAGVWYGSPLGLNLTADGSLWCGSSVA